MNSPTAQSALTAKQNRDNSLDIVKALLGLPTDAPLKLDGETIRPITDQRKRYEAILEDYQGTLKQINAFLDILEDAHKERFDLLHPRWRDPAPVVVAGVDLFQSDPETAYDVVTRTALENRLDLINTRRPGRRFPASAKTFRNWLAGGLPFAVSYGQHDPTACEAVGLPEQPDAPSINHEFRAAHGTSNGEERVPGELDRLPAYAARPRREGGQNHRGGSGGRSAVANASEKP